MPDLQHRRTTPAMITKAIDAVKSTGLEVSAVEVHSGGLVRILTQTKPAGVQDYKDLSCDAIFEVGCD